MLLMGIDVGTTRVKVLLQRPNGEVVASGFREYSVHRPKPTWVEVDLDEIWRIILLETRKLVRSTRREKVVGLAISSQGETVVP